MGGAGGGRGGAVGVHYKDTDMSKRQRANRRSGEDLQSRHRSPPCAHAHVRSSDILSLFLLVIPSPLMIVKPPGARRRVTGESCPEAIAHCEPAASAGSCAVRAGGGKPRRRRLPKGSVSLQSAQDGPCAASARSLCERECQCERAWMGACRAFRC